MDQNQLQAMLAQVLSSLDTYQAAQRSSLDIQRENQFQNINNVTNARGLLYSSLPRYQDIQFDTTKYLPALSKLYSATQQNKIKQQQYYQSAIDKINAYNQAATRLKSGGGTSGTINPDAGLL